MHHRLFLAAAAFIAPARAAAQAAPVVDTIIVETRNVFADAEAKANPLFQLTNALHVTTRPYVVMRELLFRAGEPYDSALAAETQRNLRALGIFRDVTLDTVRVDGRLAVRVVTEDGWSTNLDVGARSTGDVFTWNVGLFEQNVLGTANMAGLSYRNEVDRDALRVQGRINRAFGTRVIAEGFYDDLSDGWTARWLAGSPFRALGDRVAIVLEGHAANRRLLRFRDGMEADSVRRRAFIQRVSVAWAPVAGADGYVRVGLRGEIRREEFVAQPDPGPVVPDSVFGTVGLFAEWFRPRFIVVTHYNGFAREEDVDLGAGIDISAAAALTAFGYERNGVLPSVGVQVGAGTGKLFARLRMRANGLLTSAGVDSGQVRAEATLAARVFPRQATVLHVEAGVQDSPVLGAEFDLGHGIGPRAFVPHAFTGTRSVWGIFEHRAFLIDDLLGLIGIGLAAFVDYGGAWFGDQDARFGGDVGLGLRLGTTRSTGPNVGRFDLAYQFGDGVNGNRWVFSFGQAFEF